MMRDFFQNDASRCLRVHEVQKLQVLQILLRMKTSLQVGRNWMEIVKQLFRLEHRFFVRRKTLVLVALTANAL